MHANPVINQHLPSFAGFLMVITTLRWTTLTVKNLHGISQDNCTVQSHGGCSQCAFPAHFLQSTTMQDIYSPKPLPAIVAESPFPPLSCAVIDGALFTFPFFSFLSSPPESPHSSSHGDSPPSPSSIVVSECSLPIPGNHSGWRYPSAPTSTPVSHEGDDTLWPPFCGLHISGGTGSDEPLLHVQCSCCQARLYVPFAKDSVTCIFHGLGVGLFQNPVCRFHWESWCCWWGWFVGINQSSHWYSGFSQSSLSKFWWGQGSILRCPECGKGSDVAIN